MALQAVGLSKRHIAEPPRVVERDPDPAVEMEHHMVMRRVSRTGVREVARLGRIRALPRNCEPTGHAQMHDQRLTRAKTGEKILAAPVQRRHPGSGQALGETLGKRKAQIRPTGLRREHPLARHDRLEAAANRLDFGQLGHRTFLTVSPRRILAHMIPADDPSAEDAPSADFGAQDVPRAEKAGLVRRVFDQVADHYDVMNDLMSGGVHRIWKDMAVARVNPQPGERLIDVAGGTGDVARRFLARAGAAAARRGGAPAQALVVDVNPNMLVAGRGRRDETGLCWVGGDAESLPLPDRCADAVTIAFGIRNVTDRDAALADMRRVLKPGGRFACLEFSKPTTAALASIYDAWSYEAIPRIGDAVAKDAASYRYLVESIRRFPDQEAFAAQLRAAGFAQVSVTNYSGGVAALHFGWRL